jgi:hypothetical protein
VIIKSAEVRKAVKTYDPKFKFMVLSDPEWCRPDAEEMQAMVREVAVDRMGFVHHLFECEEFALALVTAIRGRRADLAESGKLPREQWRNWPLGIVVGTHFRGQRVDHWINICLTREGLYLIEPQTGETWQPKPTEDKFYFLLM